MYTDYINFIKKTQLILQPKDWYFKSAKKYNNILEHVTYQQGNKYLDIIINKFNTFYKNNLKFLIKICNLNDKYGKTKKYKFDNFTICSPTNLRYILHSLLILEDIKKYNLKKVDIIEIGGGYGGLCFFIHNIAPLYEININSYSNFDLLEVSLLQKKYLNALNIKNVNYYQLDNFKDLKKNSFLISNYAFSEIDISIRKEYSKKIINPYTNFGFLIWNFIPLYDFIDNCTIKKEEEYPLTKKNNYYVRYYSNKF